MVPLRVLGLPTPSSTDMVSAMDIDTYASVMGFRDQPRGFIVKARKDLCCTVVSSLRRHPVQNTAQIRTPI